VFRLCNFDFNKSLKVLTKVTGMQVIGKHLLIICCKLNNPAFVYHLGSGIKPTVIIL